MQFGTACITPPNPPTVEPESWSATDMFIGPASIIGGVGAPLACAVRYTIIPFEHPQGQGAIGILFTPFVTIFGLMTGVMRGGAMIGTGVADTVTGGSDRLSLPYWYSLGNFVQWCGCMHIYDCRPESQAPASPDEPKALPGKQETLPADIDAAF